MACEKDLPKLPLPPLQQTMDKYLAAVRPLVDDKDYERTKSLVDEFRKSGGVGERLQAILKERERTTENYVTEWWSNNFLSARDSVVINLSPGFTFPKEDFSNKLDQIRFSARLLHNTANFRDMIDNDELSIDRVGDSPMSMYQYKLFLCGSRIPRPKIDVYFVAPKGEAKHVVVVHNNQFYSLDVYGTDGKPLNEPEIAAQLLKIVQSSDAEEPPVGVLTSENRSVWAKEREVLSQDPQNKENLYLLDSCIVVLCLDKPCPPPTQRPSVDESPIDSVTARQTLHGDGIQYNSLNRWFEKPNQFTVSENGHIGVCYEHSPAEAPTIGRLWDYVLAHKNDYKSIEIAASNLPAPKKIKWNLKASSLEAIEKAKQRLQRDINAVEVKLFEFQGYGKDFIKSQKLSPDAWFQISLQLAFYRLHGHVAAPYETATVRKFKLGRSDSIRSASIPTLEFVKAMSKSYTSQAERHNLMREAISYHSKLTKEAMNGQGIDRHLFALKCASQEAGMDLPAVFADPTHKYFFDCKLSTSQVPMPYRCWTLFGPMVTDGYGICYNQLPDRVLYCLTTDDTNPITDAGHFAAVLKKSLNDMQLLATTSKL
ncbi:predicted protein [Nematostella vectensis]|uniref:Choline/carnitine acyltransferase domain-containing protein n=1 Tax=Nematostella vectensis TaxID=45351 RepID=A7RW66_NEMVE|nr:predicted protein [Nematostella vectensis]|eukprot:XP_001636321.1 predicted protein [Nematostella vectensis]